MYPDNDCIPLGCIPPHVKLLNAVKDNDRNLISSLIEDDLTLLTYEYPEYNKNILEAACAGDLSGTVQDQTVALLIDLGADLEQPNAHYQGMRVLHFAAQAMNVDILTVVLEKMEKKHVSYNLTTDVSCNTALLHILRNVEHDDDRNFLNCIKLLASKVDVNCVDHNLIPAIYVAAKKGLRNVIAILKSKDLDVDSYTDRNKQSSRDLIVALGFKSDDFPRYKCLDNEGLVQKIYTNSITEGDLENLEDVNKDFHGGTLLQLLTEHSLVDLIGKLMMYTNLDCNKTTSKNKTAPIDIAVERADYRTLDILLSHPQTNIPKHLLCQVLLNFDRTAPSIEGRSYKKCALVCLENHRVRKLLNKPGDKDQERGNYPLHYACRYADESTILALLKEKASLANRNRNEYLTINDIKAKTLEAHLDSCLTIHERQPKCQNDEREVHFDFTTLLPTLDDSEDIPIDIPIENGNSKVGYQEVDGKLLTNGKDRCEMSVPKFMSESQELKHLLTHPILAMFINLKWQQVNRIYYINLLFYIILCISLYTYIFLSYINADFQNYIYSVKLFSNIVYVVNIGCLVALLLREFFQFWLEIWKYFKNLENYIELILLCTMVVIVLPALNSDYSARKQVASIAILFSALELFLLIGKKPNLSTNIVILQTVSLTFFKLLLWYSILICAFAMSFYTLFSGQKQEEGDDPNFFTNPALAVIKTIVMLTGEFDAGNIKFDSIPVISHMIFLMFVFMISMVLFNLMNGLAVTDTQLIKTQSELYSLRSQVEYIAYIEALLTDHKLSSYWKKLCKRSYFTSNGSYTMCVPLHQGGKSRGYIKGSVTDRVPIRQSIVKQARDIIEQRKIEKDAKVALNAEKAKFKQMEKTLQEMSKKLEELSEKQS